MQAWLGFVLKQCLPNYFICLNSIVHSLVQTRGYFSAIPRHTEPFPSPHPTSDGASAALNGREICFQHYRNENKDFQNVTVQNVVAMLARRLSDADRKQKASFELKHFDVLMFADASSSWKTAWPVKLIACEPFVNPSLLESEFLCGPLQAVN